MTKPLRIVHLGYEDLVLKMRQKGKTGAEILIALNAEQAKRIAKGEKVGAAKISKSALMRYIATLPAATAAVVHDPKGGGVILKQSINVMQRIADTVARIDDLMPEALAELDPFTQHRNWAAITALMKESRQQSEFYANVLEKVYNAEQIKLFQESVLEAIQEASPEVARIVRDKMREKTSIRRAALLGAAA